MESQIVVNILTCISQENHKSCYTPSFPRFHQELIVVVLDYSFSIFILIFFLWICITLASLSSEGKNLVKKERLNIWIICNEMSPSQQILVPRMSRGRPTSKTSPKDPISPPQGRPNLTSWDVLKWRPGDILIWRPKDLPGRLIWDVPQKTFKALKLECPKISFNFSFRTYSIDQIYLKAFQHSRCIQNLVKRLEWSVFCEIS